MTAKTLFRALMTTTALTFALAPLSASADVVEDLQNQVQYLTQMLTSVQQTLQNVLAQQNAQGQQIQQQQQQISETQADAKNAGDPGFKIKWDPSPTISSTDGRFSMHVRGRVLVDAGWASNDDTADVKATEFRAARIGIEGKAWNNVNYKFEMDFAGGSATVKDAFVKVNSSNFSATLGQQNQPFSLEEISSSRFNTFMERPAWTTTFGLERQIGAVFSTHGKDWTASAGLMRGDFTTSNRDEGTTFGGRITYGPKVGETQLHIGGGVLVRKVGMDQPLERFRNRPYAHFTPDRFIDTGLMFDKDVLFNVEGLVMHGPLAVQSEFAWDAAHVPGESDRANFHGGNVEISYFLTGESRTYEASKGEMGRPKVNHPVFQGGMGAWQIAYRYDFVDLNDVINLDGGGMMLFRDGRQVSHIIGVNWYWNPYVRFMINYARSRITGAFDVAADGGDGTNTVDSVGLRAQVDW
jgi:phosphate-selective porin OprO and OprP